MPTMSATAVDVLVDHKVVRKIACLGSGFVGGKVWTSASLSDIC